MKSLSLLIILISTITHAGIRQDFYLNGKRSTLVEPGKRSVLEMQYQIEVSNEETGDSEWSVLNDFQPHHSKTNHMLVLKDDFSSFRHVHPYYDESTGFFHLTINGPTANPDNKDSQSVLQLPGRYYIFTELKSRNYGMRKFKQIIQVGLQDHMIPLEVDKPDSEGVYQKYLSHPNHEADYYRADLRLRRQPGCAGVIVHYELRLNKREGDQYTPVTDYQPWLMMGGHLALFKVKEKLDLKDYYHLHAEKKENSPLLDFNVFNRGQLTSGIYKMWIQLRHQNHVLKVPFTIDFVSQFNPTTCS